MWEEGLRRGRSDFIMFWVLMLQILFLKLRVGMEDNLFKEEQNIKYIGLGIRFFLNRDVEKVLIIVIIYLFGVVFSVLFKFFI